MITLHQIWLGSAMPPRIATATAILRAQALRAGWRYRLWTAEDIRSAFGSETPFATLAPAEGAQPTAVFASLLSDWARWRIIVEEGGLYLDTDTHLNGPLPSAADLLSHGDIALHTRRDTRMEIGCIVAAGNRGRAAAAHIVAAISARLQQVGEINAAIARVPLPALIGPAWLIDSGTYTSLRARGYTVEPLPPELASCTRSTATFYHWGSWTWHHAQREGQQNSHSGRLRPRPLYTPQELPQAVLRQKESLFVPPAGCRRIIIFSNLAFNPDVLCPLRPGDWCIHINRARHAAAAMQEPDTWHTLFVRHGGNEGTGYKWYTPETLDGFRSVIFYGSTRIPEEPWLPAYKAGSGASNPTSGFICYQHARAAAPNLPIVLAGFAPGEDIGYRWPQHGWDYEAEYYTKNKVTLLHP